MKKREKAILGFTLLLILGAMILLGWEAVNFADRASLVFWFLLFMSLAVLLSWSKIMDYLKPFAQIKHYIYIGADFGDLQNDLGICLIVTVLFLGFISYQPALAMGLPHQLQSTDINDYFTLVVGLGPIIEEIFFRSILLNIFYILDPTGGAMTLVGQAATFSVYHWSAYGIPYYGNYGALIGAFLFGMVAGGLVLTTKNLFSSIPLHILTNYYIFGTKTNADPGTMWYFLSLLFVVGLLLLLWPRIFKEKRRRG